MFYYLKNKGKTSYARYNLSLVEIKDYNVVDGQNVFDQAVKNDLITYENIRKIATGEGDGYTTSCLLDYRDFKNYYKMVAINLSKQQALDSDLKLLQQINFTANLDWDGNTTMFFITEEAKETVLGFSQGTDKVL